MGQKDISWLSRLRSGLSRSRQALSLSWIRIGKGGLSEEAVEGLEEALLGADFDLDTVEDLIQEARTGQGGSRVVAEKLISIFREIHRPFSPPPSPGAIFLIGVNGGGKTTTAAKLGWRLKEDGWSPILVAADTYRAAAIDQLTVWADRLRIDLVKHQPGGDPGAVVFDAVEAVKARRKDFLVIDTAGRLHTRVPLMEELKKMARVVEKSLGPDRIKTLLTIDGTTGKNALSQAEVFHQALSVDGIVMTKLDGTAKGGTAVSIARHLGLPIMFVGVGEDLEDLIPFDPEAFVEALLPAADS